MDINATLVGQSIVVFALIVGVISYYLGRRKTQQPVLAGIIGVLAGLVPLLGIIYLIVLVLKNDIKANASESPS